MRIHKFEEIQEKLDRALKLCEQLKLGQKVENSRFTKYKRYLNELIAIINKFRSGTLTSQDQQKLKENNRIYLASLMESMEFSEVIENLVEVDQKFLKIKINDILQGPELPSDENANSNLSRNTLFELSFASLLKRAGIQPLFGENPDVRCEINDSNFYFECKRPISKKKISLRIKEGGKQLLKVLANKDSKENEGVIIISIAGNCGTDSPFIPIANSAIAYKGMDNLLNQTAIRTKPTWGKFDKPGPISGVLFHTRGIFLVGEENRYIGGSWWFGLQFGHVQDSGFIKLQNALSALKEL